MGPCSYGSLHTLRGFNTKSPFYRLGNSLNFLYRGLYALILTIFFQTTLLAEYLYEDKVLLNSEFKEEINTLGAELYEKTGIALRIIMLKKLPEGVSIVDYEKKTMEVFGKTPTVLLTFSELDKKVDIYANPESLYKYFDKKQVLSPVSSPVQAFIISVINFKSFDSFIEALSNYGGTILPIISLKNKDGEVLGKYSAGMYNGYTDIAEQIAKEKNIELLHAGGNTNKDTLFIVKLLFYGFVLYAIFMYIKRKLYIKRHLGEKN